jgi:adenylate cyclase
MNDKAETNVNKPAIDGEPPAVEKQSVTEPEIVVADTSLAAQNQPPSRFLLPLINFFSSFKVSYKIAGTFIIVLSLTVITLGTVTFARQKEILQHEMKARASVLVQQLANVGKEALLTKQDLSIVSTITDIQKRDDVVYAMILDHKGKVFAHSDYSLKGKILPGEEAQAALEADAMIFQDTLFNSDHVLDAAIPITMQAKNLKIGVARIGLSQKALNEAISKQKTIYLLMALAFVVTGIVVSFVLARALTKPLDLLADGIRLVSLGDLRSLVTVTSKDEIGEVTNIFNQMVLSLREKTHMEKYLSQSTVNSIKQNRDQSQLKLGGERKYVTALFSDVRGFTSLSEKMSPEEVVTLMNTYLNLQTAVILSWGGSVDKFVGDEVMAIFEGHGNEINAVRAAVEIQHYCKALNAARSASGQMPVSIGIGLNSGDVVMGNMGSENQMDYTVIGDNINVAARLCGAAHAGQVLVSKAIADAIAGQATYKTLPPITVKGKDKPIEIAEVGSASGCMRQHMRKEITAQAVYSLEGFSEEINSALIKNLSPLGCLLAVNVPIAIGSKLSVSFNLPEFGDIKVRADVRHASKQEDAYHIALFFDDMQQDTQSELVRWIHRVNT